MSAATLIPAKNAAACSYSGGLRRMAAVLSCFRSITKATAV